MSEQDGKLLADDGKPDFSIFLKDMRICVKCAETQSTGDYHKTGSEITNKAEPQELTARDGAGGFEGGESVDKEKPRRWWARLDKRMTFRCVLGVAWIWIYITTDEKFRNATSLEEKIDAIFLVLQGIWFIAICLINFWDRLIHQQ